MRDSRFEHVANKLHDKEKQSLLWNDIFSLTKLKEPVPPESLGLPGLMDVKGSKVG